MNPIYNNPPTGWEPAESRPGHIVHWDGPAIVGPGVFLVTTFRLDDGITLQDVDGNPIDPGMLLWYARRMQAAYEEITRAEAELNA